MNNKIFYGAVGLVAILVLAFLGYRAYHPPFTAGSTPTTSTSVDFLPSTGVTKYDDVAAGEASTRFVTLNIGSGTSTAIIVNRAPFTRWITKQSLLTLTGNATDTPYRIYVGTTTSITNAGDTVAGNGQRIPLYVAPPFAGIVSNYAIATSTEASSSPMAILPRSADSGYQDAVPWISGQGIFMVLQVDTGNAARNLRCPGQVGLSNCSAATSTDRGFNIELLLDTYSTSTVR